MKEVICFSCDDSLSDISRFLGVSGSCVQAGYELRSFKIENGLEAIFTSKEPNPIGFTLPQPEEPKPKRKRRKKVASNKKES